MCKTLRCPRLENRFTKVKDRHILSVCVCVCFMYEWLATFILLKGFQMYAKYGTSKFKPLHKFNFVLRELKSLFL